MKLIIINGPSGVGKSTLAEKLHAEMPLSLLIDVDAWRRFINGYREYQEESRLGAYALTCSAVDTYLARGHDVIIDKNMTYSPETLDTLQELGEKHGAEVYEFLLTIERDALIERAAARGFNPGSLLTPAKVEESWDAMQKIKDIRLDAMIIDATHIDADTVFTQVTDIVSRGAGK